MIVAITGSSGLVGTALIEALEADGHFVRPMVRRAPRADKHEIRWDPAAGTIDAAELATVDAVVNLAGENIAAKRWTPAFKQQILDSRIRSTNLLCQTLAGLATKPTVLVSASATGYYGSRGDAPVDETAAPGAGFLADVCQQWEAATKPARDADIRVVNLRIGFVLARDGGGLAKMLTPFKLGLGGVIGSGRQYISWIALDDLVRAIQFTLAASTPAGPVNAVSPQPVTNRDFTKTLGQVLKRPTIFPMPAFAAKLAFGEMADNMLLSSIRVEPRVLTAARFEFAYPDLESALRHVVT
ncbi:MAG TPA: TIGR01777 family oxidoreductase [Lacipirellulaceae bacterium]|nr:TIGR01777 family oxidoreductase [Lacipirellulaceae bacterium]